MTRSYEFPRSLDIHTFDPREAARRVGRLAADRAGAQDVDGGFPAADIAELHAAGLLLAPFPRAMGGIGIGCDPDDPERLMDVLVAVGRGSLSLGRLYEGHVNAVTLVARYGAAANLEILRQEALAGIPSGVWMAEAATPLRLERDTELATSQDGASRKDGTKPTDQATLKGEKILASGAGHFRRPLVAARDGEASMMVIPFVADPLRADAGSWTTLGMRATATGTVDFTGIRVGADEIVGKPGDYMTSPWFRGGAWRVIAVQLGGVEAILGHFRDQLAGSRNVSDPLQLARFGETLIAAETARLWVRQACRTAEDPMADPAFVDSYVDLARNAFEQAALQVIAGSQKAIGLRAFLRPNPMERVIRDLSTYLRQPALDASLTSAAAFHLGSAAGGRA